jgi:hypothetical protein
VKKPVVPDLSEGALAWLTAVAKKHPQSNAAELLRWVQAMRGAPHD